MRMIELTVEQYEELRESNAGYCLHCGIEQLGDVEPDASQYICEDCGEAEVYGIEELLIMGRIELLDED